MPYVSTYIDEQDVLEELDTDDILAELKRRGLDYNTSYVDGEEMRIVLNRLYEKRRTGKDYQIELDTLIYGVLGKVI